MHAARHGGELAQADVGVLGVDAQPVETGLGQDLGHRRVTYLDPGADAEATLKQGLPDGIGAHTSPRAATPP